MTYGACCLVANILILYRFNNFTGWGELLVALMCLAYFTAFWFENNFTMFKEVYGIFYETFSCPGIWLTLFLTCGIIAAVEYGNRAVKAVGLFERIPMSWACLNASNNRNQNVGASNKLDKY